MWKPLVRKELRELAGITTLAAAAYLILVSGLAGMTPFSALPYISAGVHAVPFVNSTFASLFSTITLAFAIALGFRQSAWEWARHTYLFLLYRPLPRSQIFLIKMATGLTVLMVVSAACILAYALWAATPGTHPSPFFWSMTQGAWRLWLGCSVVYLGAFLSGARAARWFGTRLLPLVASLMVLPILAGTAPQLPASVAITAFADVLLAISVCHIVYAQDFS